MNPYSDSNFLTFFTTLLSRLMQFFSGRLALADLASDEVQLIVLSFISLSSAIVGSFLVLRKMTMLANSLSHTILLGIVLAFLLVMPFSNGSSFLSVQTLLIASLLTALVTALLTQFFTYLLKLQEDASIGLVFTTLFALGVVLVTLFTRNTHLDVEAVMGNADALHPDDIQFVFWIALANLALLLLFYKQMQATAFDASLSRFLGISSSFFSYLLMVQTSATVIGAFRSVGVLLVLAFLVGPALIARLFSIRLRGQLWIASLIGIFSSLFGVALSRHMLSAYEMPLSTAGLVVTVIALFYVFSLLLITLKKRRLAASNKAQELSPEFSLER